MKKFLLMVMLITQQWMGLATTFTISTSGFVYTPATITINVGDIVKFDMSGTNHDALEVSQATWNANNTTPLSGGFSFPIGGAGTVPSGNLTVGTHYFVCTPHVFSHGQKGTIIVQNITCTIPSSPPLINGNISVCQSSSNTYSVTSVSGATSYVWSLPSGWSGSSTTNTITSIASASNGTVSVSAVNACGSSTPTTLSVSSGSVPSAPSAISGNSTVCNNSTNTFSVNAGSGVISYSWTLPSGWSGSSNTNSISATSSALGGTITVKATSNCGTSGTTSLNVATAVPPAMPSSINGNTTACANSLNQYFISAVSGADSYTWTLPSGWSGNSSTSLISATSNTSGGTITVKANNGCASSSVQSLSVITGTIPISPSSITGNTSVCMNSANTYSVNPISDATSYTWTLPSGWTGTSTTNSINTIANSTSGTIKVVANNACGSSAMSSLVITGGTLPSAPSGIIGNASVCINSTNTYSVNTVFGALNYTWTLPNGWTGSSSTNSINAVATSTNGSITVTANNACGSSATTSLTISGSNVPSTPSGISGNTSVCLNSTNIYSINPVSGATSYTWTIPSGWTGTSTTNIINTVAISTNGTISVTANNTCGSSPVSSITINGANVPATPSAITGTASVCVNSTNNYSVNAVSGATSYTWILPSGWTGISNSNSINAIANNTNGAITVTANNTCGTSSGSTLIVTTKNVLSQPLNIIGNTSVCAKSSNFYFIASEPSATSYAWTLPGGWKGSSSTNTITAIADTNSGNLSVAINNTCGASPPQMLSLKTNQVNKAIVQSGSTLTASATGASYQWMDCNTKSTINGQTNQSFTATANGNYGVIIKQNNCIDTSICFALVTVGNKEVETSSTIRLFPNPSTGSVHIELTEIKSAGYEIFNAIGQKISSGTIKSKDTLIDLVNQINGIYFIKIFTPESGTTRKLVLE